MSIDFRSDQIRVNKIIASGSTGTQAKILIYPVNASSNLQGGINFSTFNTSSIGSDVFLYVSGAINTLGLPQNGGVVFGGDVHFSGATKTTKTATFDDSVLMNSSLTVFSTASFLQNIIGFSSASFNGPISGFGKLTITGLSTLNQTVISGNFIAVSGFSGSLQSLKDGTPYLIGQGNVSVTTQSNGSILISGSGASFPSASNGSVLAHSSNTWSATNVGTFGQPLISSGSGKALFDNRVVPLQIGTGVAIPSDAALALGWAYKSIVIRDPGNTSWLDVWRVDGSGYWNYGTSDSSNSSGTTITVPGTGQFSVNRGGYSHISIDSSGRITLGTTAFQTTLLGSSLIVGQTSVVSEYRGGAKVPETTISTDTTLGNSIEVVFVDTNAGHVTASLPTGASGRVIALQRISGSNDLVVVRGGSDTIRAGNSGSLTEVKITDNFRHGIIFRSAATEWVFEY
jgi:hypothetical protein